MGLDVNCGYEINNFSFWLFLFFVFTTDIGLALVHWPRNVDGGGLGVANRRMEWVESTDI